MIPADVPRVPRLRWRITALITAGVLINYFDRIGLSVAGPQLEHSFQLTPADLGLGAFMVAGLVSIAGVAAFVFLLGRIERIPEPAPRYSQRSANAAFLD